MNNDFKLQGNQIYSLASGDLVATIDTDGNLKMQPGKNAMSPKVKAFYETEKNEDAPAKLSEMTGNTAFTQALNEAEEVNTHKLAEEFFEEPRIAFGDAPNVGGTSAPAREKAPEAVKDPAALSVWDIPNAELPAFDFALGVDTPDFKTFVRKHKFNKAQTAELVKRLERRK